MFLIRHNIRLRIFSDGNDWTDNISDFKEYESEDDAYADVIRYALDDCTIVPVKEWVANLISAGQIRLGQ
jgi:hypothetical protein